MKTFNINVTKIMVMLTTGTDKVFLYTDMPCPYVKEAIPSQQALMMQFDTTYDKGIEYVKQNFDIEPEILNCRNTLGRNSW